MYATAEPQAGRFQCSPARPGEVSSAALRARRRFSKGKVADFSRKGSEKNPAYLEKKSVSLEAIAKLFENASQWSWQDNAFVYFIVDPMLPLSLRIKSIPPTTDLFFTYRKTVISFLSPWKIFCFNRGCHIQLKNEFPAPITSIIHLFGDRIRHITVTLCVSTAHNRLLLIIVSDCCALFRHHPFRGRLARRLARRSASACPKRGRTSLHETLEIVKADFKRCVLLP
jgi:hypothetical protein